jgi:carotenoid cleavage dioxygenase-like enzyme
MQRRLALNALAAAAATLCMPAIARPARADVYAERFASEPLLRPFKGIDDAGGDRSGEALLRGRWPSALRGRFYRNGPALFERGGERYHHWFDGDGMVQQFSIGDGPGGTRISHRGRLVRTSKLQTEQRAGRFLMSAFGTQIEGGPPGGGPDAFNTANTNALEHAGRVLALWEGGSAYALDPQDLSTRGPVVWRKDLAQVPFSAHPKVDARGELWNIGSFGKHLVVWHIDAAGRLIRSQLGESPLPGGIVHDFAVTARHLVVPLPPVRLDFGQPFGTGGRGEGPRPFAMLPGEPLRILVMEKSDIARRRVFELPAQMVFHVGNAWETGDGEIVLNYIGAPDTWFLNEGAVALMQARASGTPAAARIEQLRLHLGSGRVEQHGVDSHAEFPRVDPRRIGEPSRWLLSGAAWGRLAQRPHALLHGVQLLDLDTGRVRRHDYGAHQIAEEHVLVPKPGGRGELDAWLLGTSYDSRRQATVLNLLEAAHIEDGPVAQAVLPYALPPGFHGNFTAA